MIITAYNSELTAIGAVDIIDTLIWVRRDTEFGSFELTVPVSENNLRLIQKGNIIKKGSDREIAYIKSITISKDENGETIKATGVHYCGVLKQRCVKTNASNMKSLIENNLRSLPYFRISDDCANITFDNNFKGENLGDVITALAKANGFGFTGLLNGSYVDFVIYYGTDRSIEQSENPYCTFSDKLENLSGCEYTDSNIGVINTVYVECKIPAGCETPASIPSYTLSSTTGINSFEQYVVIDAVTYDATVYLPEGEQITKTYLDSGETMIKMQAAARNVLVEAQENFQGTVNFKLNYRTDYDIGDIVTIKNSKWNKNISQKITEITETYDNLNDAITPTFGNPQRTIMDILKKVK